MSTIINADTSDGLKFTSDTSGEIKLQSAGADIATVSSTGITMAAGKTLPAASLTGTAPSGVMPSGSILQVVQSRTNSTISSTSASDVASGLTASITPSSTSSKILVSVTGGNVWNNTNDGNVVLSIYRSIGGGGYSSVAGAASIVQNTSGTNSVKSSWSAEYLDSPSTTSAITYQPYYKQSTGTGYFNESTGYVNLTLIEVAG